MNPMMKSFLFPLAMVCLTLFSTSCNECIGMFGKEKIVCSNGGTCNDGECDCLKGYSGPTCDSLDLCELNDVDCVFGLCEDGTCECQEGYEGKLCDVETRAKFLGEYTIGEFCDKLDTVQGHTMRIERDLLNPTNIEMYNVFNDQQFPVVGFYSKVEGKAQSGKLTFSIFNQRPDDNDKTINGSGIIDLSDTNNVTISMDYTVTNGNKTYSCTLQGVRN